MFENLKKSKPAQAFPLYLAAFLFMGCFLVNCNSSKNIAVDRGDLTLTEAEQRDNWKLLFDGGTTAGWHTYGKKGVGKGWKVADGILWFDAKSITGENTTEGGDIVTDKAFENFHLKLEWKIAKNGNSGILFFVQDEPAKYQAPWQSGPEMQVLDNAGHPDAKILKHRAGDLYDLITAKEAVMPAGEWNRAEVIVNNNTLRLLLNGEEVVKTTLWDEQWRQLIANSKFKNMPGFGNSKRGHIALQDHGDNVWYRNIKIKEL